MAIRPGIDFKIAGASEFAALVCISERAVMLEAADDRVAGSSGFFLAPVQVVEPKKGGVAAIRFAPADWCKRAQRSRPAQVRVVSAERGMDIAEKATAYTKAGLAVSEAVRRAYTEVTGNSAVDKIDVASFHQERERLLDRLAHERGLELRDQNKWGHLTNDNLRDVLADPILIEQFSAEKPEAPELLSEASAEEKERREIYDFLRANGVRVPGWPGLIKLKAMLAEYEEQDKQRQIDALSAQAVPAGVE